jgi:phosphotransferase system  glucose/maltose/N-acetylglucosamine-specific IIC component
MTEILMFCIGVFYFLVVPMFFALYISRARYEEKHRTQAVKCRDIGKRKLRLIKGGKR